MPHGVHIEPTVSYRSNLIGLPMWILARRIASRPTHVPIQTDCMELLEPWSRGCWTVVHSVESTGESILRKKQRWWWERLGRHTGSNRSASSGEDPWSRSRRSFCYQCANDSRIPCGRICDPFLQPPRGRCPTGRRPGVQLLTMRAPFPLWCWQSTAATKSTDMETMARSQFVVRALNLGRTWEGALDFELSRTFKQKLKTKQTPVLWTFIARQCPAIRYRPTPRHFHSLYAGRSSCAITPGSRSYTADKQRSID